MELPVYERVCVMPWPGALASVLRDEAQSKVSKLDPFGQGQRIQPIGRAALDFESRTEVGNSG